MVARKKISHRLQAAFRILLLFGIIALANFIASKYYKRFDLTVEKRYTLSDATKDLLRNLDDQVFVRVYLEGKAFPAGFKRLRNATEEMLYEFGNASNGKVNFIFIDPTLGDKEQKEALQKELYEKGLTPTNLRVQNDEGASSQIIFPGLMMHYREKEVALQLLENQVGLGPNEALNNSVELLEYKIANSIKKITQRQSPRIAFAQSEGELDKMFLNDIARTLQDYQYDLRLISISDELVLANKYDILVIAKPTQPFREIDKFKIDQYIMNGGSVLWLIDPVNMSMDSLLGKELYMTNSFDLNLEDMLFKYGARVNTTLVQDLQCNGIPLVVGAGNPPQTEFFPWYFYPIITSNNSHAIVKNLDAVMGQFVSTIDTVKAPGVKKTVLLSSSKYSKALQSPMRIHFGMVKDKPDVKNFTQSNLPLAVLLEGKFNSVFTNRLAANTLQVYKDSFGIDFKDTSVFAKQIVIGDGDMIKNQVSSKGSVYPLGYYPYTEQTFANKDLLLNCIEYLSDDAQLIETRNKEIKLRLLDSPRIKQEATKWQAVNMGAPVLFIAVFGVIYNLIRRRRFAR
ncbi:MAG: gliding motility-associated ABC transporter substrate-binding protein GldG [Chitinophagales bacterium]|nr:gliding motility-associated ABC transporter substrate-binding protein GldG [Chitinophagales bacterium]